ATGRRAKRGQAKKGIAAEILRTLTNVEDALVPVRQFLSAAMRGKRHNTMVGAALALAMHGYSDAAIFAALEPVYCDLMDDLSWEAASEEVASAVQWARGRVGLNDAEIAVAMAPAFDRLAATWNRRWRRE